jgi:diguanylate cyclase (GGDEF)-like protein
MVTDVARGAAAVFGASPGWLRVTGSRSAPFISAGCALMVTVAFGFALATRAGGELGVLRVDDLGQLSAAIAAGATAVWASWRSAGRMRASWAAIGFGAGMWALGQGVWCYYELIGHRATPFPSVADAGYLVFPVGAAAGLWLFPSSEDCGARRRWLLDGGIIVSALITMSWATSLGAVSHAGGVNVFAFTVSLAYPVGDILILSMALLGLCRPRAQYRQLLLLSVAITAMAVADSSFAYLTAVGKYRTGSLSDIGWVAAFLLLAVAAVSSGSHPSAPATGVHGDPSAGAERPAAATMLPYLPVLFAAAIPGIRRIQGHDLAAVEFVSLSVSMVLVLARQYTTVRENRGLVRAVAAREAQLHRQAFYDRLTGLANRALFINRAEHALNLHRRDLRPLSVLFCDLDDFKTVNDTLGHGAGDELLIRVAERLTGAVRPGDTLARLGGDEFAVLLEDGGDPAALGARLVQALHVPFTIAGTQLTVRASVGLNQLLAEEHTPSLDALLAHADIAMYAAKRAGKGQLACYDATMSSPHAKDIALRQPLIDAIAGHRIRAAYQPIITMATGKITGVEALARWDHRGAAIAPHEFIPIASRAGMLGELTDDMLEQACAQLAVWSSRLGHHELTIAVNIPPSLATDRAFPARVARVVERHRLHPQQLVLEITEEALLQDLTAAREVTGQLRDFGVRLSLDDFGTGYSSLLHLQQIPLDSLKIDRGFITDIDTDPAAERLVGGIMSLAISLGLDVVAEGIERPAQARTLQRVGCALAQGYLYARPTSAEEITHLLSAEADHNRAKPPHPRTSRPTQAAVNRNATPPALLVRTSTGHNEQPSRAMRPELDARIPQRPHAPAKTAPLDRGRAGSTCSERGVGIGESGVGRG